MGAGGMGITAVGNVAVRPEQAGFAGEIPGGFSMTVRVATTRTSPRLAHTLSSARRVSTSTPLSVMRTWCSNCADLAPVYTADELYQHRRPHAPDREVGPFTLTSVDMVQPSSHKDPLAFKPCTRQGSMVKQCPGSMTSGSLLPVSPISRLYPSITRIGSLTPIQVNRATCDYAVSTASGGRYAQSRGPRIAS
jgi:hypothetical protein